MGSFFEMDNVFFRVTSKLFDLIVLNVVFILCCVPLITVGAAFTALYTVTMKSNRNEEGYIVKDYFRALVRNFRQSTVLAGGIVAVTAILIWDINYIKTVEGIVGKILFFGILFMLCVLVIVVEYVFPLLAQFDNSIIAMIKNAIIIGIGKLGWTVLLITIDIVFLSACFIGGGALRITIPLCMLFGFSGIAYVKSFILNSLFKPYVQAAEEES